MRLGHLFADGQDRVEAGRGVLKDEAEIPAGDRGAFHVPGDAAFGFRSSRQEACKGFRKRALAGTAFADDREAQSFFDAEPDFGERFLGGAGIGDGKVLDAAEFVRFQRIEVCARA